MDLEEVMEGLEWEGLSSCAEWMLHMKGVVEEACSLPLL